MVSAITFERHNYWPFNLVEFLNMLFECLRPSGEEELLNWLKSLVHMVSST